MPPLPSRPTHGTVIQFLPPQVSRTRVWHDWVEFDSLYVTWPELVNTIRRKLPENSRMDIAAIHVVWEGVSVMHSVAGASSPVATLSDSATESLLAVMSARGWKDWFKVDLVELRNN